LLYEKDKFQFALSPSSENIYELSVEESDHQWSSIGVKRSFDDCVSSAQKTFDAFLSKIPKLPGKYKQSRELASYILWSCIIDKGGNYKRPGMLMSKNWMHYIWSWDHCFNAMASAYGLPNVAWDNYITVFDAQDASGRLPDVLGYARMDRTCLKAPIHGWTLNKMQKSMKLTDSQLQHAYDTLKRWTDYWFVYRDSNKNGVPEYIQANDCWDNGTEFNINGNPNYIANRESATLSSYLITQTDELHELALKLGKKDDAVDWKKKSDHLLKHMLDKLWDGDKFITVNIEDGSVNKKSQSSQRFIPFIVGEKLPDDIRAKMIEDLKGGGYLTDWGIATESIHSPFYTYNGYWTGPIWAPHTLIIADGLKRAGEHELSKEITQKFCDMCVKSGFAENFDPKTGEALRDKAYTWTASVFLLLGHEYLD
jgi:putative isomerase